jgi:hypothetical protein
MSEISSHIGWVNTSVSKCPIWLVEAAVFRSSAADAAIVQSLKDREDPDSVATALLPVS